MSTAKTQQTPVGFRKHSLDSIARGVLRAVMHDAAIRPGLSITLSNSTGGIVDIEWTLDGRFEAEARAGSQIFARIEAIEQRGVCRILAVSASEQEDAEVDYAISVLNTSALESVIKENITEAA